MTTTTTNELHESLVQMSTAMQTYRQLQKAAAPLVDPAAIEHIHAVSRLSPFVGHALESAGVLAVVVPGLVVVNNPTTKQLCPEVIDNETQRRLGLPQIGFHRGLN